MNREKVFYIGLALFAVGAVVVIMNLPFHLIVKIAGLALLTLGILIAADAFIRQLNWAHHQSGLIVEYQTERTESLQKIANLSLMVRVRDLKEETPKAEKRAAQAHRFDNGERGQVIPLFPPK